MNAKSIVKNIIKDNIYLSLSTCDGKNPWVAPLVYVYDEKYNFYFVSQINSLHGKHIIKNSNVAFTIFDSHQPNGTGKGIQVLGKASIIKKYPEAVIKYFKNLRNISIDLSKYIVFKIKPIKFYVPDNDFWEKHGIDKRMEIKIISFNTRRLKSAVC